MTQSMMNSCPVCGKRHVIMWPDMYVYRRGPTYYCSEDCMIVAATKDQKMIKMIAHMRAKKGSKKEMKLTNEQIQQCIDMALHGESPLKYIEGCGINNPACAWWNIKKNLQKNDPETYEKLPAKFKGVQAKKEPEPPEQAPTVKLSGPIRIETPEADKVEIVETPEDPPTRVIRRVCGKYEVSAIRVPNIGEFYYDIKYNSINWRSEAGDEVSLSPIGWKNLAEELPDILAALGAKV